MKLFTAIAAVLEKNMLSFEFYITLQEPSVFMKLKGTSGITAANSLAYMSTAFRTQVIFAEKNNVQLVQLTIFLSFLPIMVYASAIPKIIFLVFALLIRKNCHSGLHQVPCFFTMLIHTKPRSYSSSSGKVVPRSRC